MAWPAIGPRPPICQNSHSSTATRRALVARIKFSGLAAEILQDGAGLEHRDRPPARAVRIDDRRNAVVRRNRQKLRRELLALGNIDRMHDVRQPALFEHDGNFPAVRRRPIVQRDRPVAARPPCASASAALLRAAPACALDSGASCRNKKRRHGIAPRRRCKVMRGHRRQTEGVGEMPEDQVHWQVRQGEERFTRTPSSLPRAMRSDHEARTSVPPTPPVDHLSRPVLGDHRSTFDVGRPV